MKYLPIRTKELLNTIEKRIDKHYKFIFDWFYRNISENELEDLLKSLNIKLDDGDYSVDEYKIALIIKIFEFFYISEIVDADIQNEFLWKNCKHKEVLPKMELEYSTLTHQMFNEIAKLNKLLDFMDKNIEKRFIFYHVNLEGGRIYETI